MKILFVCQRNNGRSQIAKGLYNKLTGTEGADSAGIAVDNDGQLLQERAQEPGSDVGKVIDVMAEEGVDVRGYKRTQFNSDMLNRYDKVVFILERNKIPEELQKNYKTEIWDIEDPKTKDLNGVRDTKEVINRKILEMLFCAG